jgi:hypothetical protein
MKRKGFAMRRAMLQLIGAALVTLAFTATARAEDKAVKSAQPAPITIEVVVTQRVPRPQAAVDVSRIAPSRPLAQLKQPLLDRVEKAIDKAPF